MANLLFIVLLGLYVIVAVRVNAWRFTSALGYKLNTPQGFLVRPNLYRLVQSGFFLSAAATSSLTNAIPWYISVPALLIAWNGSLWLGRRRAFDMFRQTQRDMIEYEDSLKDSDPAEYQRITQESGYAESRASLKEYSKKTNKELVAMLRLLTKHGI